jgi:hypothetical protein
MGTWPSKGLTARSLGEGRQTQRRLLRALQGASLLPPIEIDQGQQFVAKLPQPILTSVVNLICPMHCSDSTELDDCGALCLSLSVLRQTGP